jgi:hypothetical protein
MGLSPEQRLEPPTAALIDAGIESITDMETLRACVAYENSHQNRTPVLRRLERKATEGREKEPSEEYQERRDE